MSEIKDGGPAFPISIPGVGDNGYGGMSLRDWFAGRALEGFMAGAWGDDTKNSPAGLAAFAYRVADALLKARGGDQ